PLSPMSAAAPAPAAAPVAAAEAQIRSTVARWYEELGKKEDGRPYLLTAPGFIDASPHYLHVNNGSRALGPRLYTSLAATALKFDYDLDGLRADAAFARVQVWERGYFYAWAAGTTYERGMATTFVLERQADGRWLILAHQSDSIGIPPNKVTDPMPDLRSLWEAREGKEPGGDSPPG
ncbi:MAG TPA: hypothetical protein VK472_04055, partial [Allosphingosinicella sp.]|nr:hypothetical protein [Allosphingosinicella sp.]